jgi:prophage regulatory protein
MKKRSAQPIDTPTRARSTGDERILSTAEVLARIPLDRTTLWRMCREGTFPRPIQLTRSRIGWRWSLIAAWLAEREADPIEPREYFGRAAGEE